MARLKAIFGVLVVVGGFYLAFQLLPPYVNNYSFQDSLDSEVRQSVYAVNRTDQQIRDSVMKSAKDNNIPIQPDDIKIEHGHFALSISVEYTVHVDLPVHPVDLSFHPHSANKQL